MIPLVWNPNNYLASLHAAGPWVVGALIATLGFTVVARERASKVSLAFCLLTTSAAIWLLSVGVLYSALDQSVALWWAKAEHLGVVFIPSAVLVLTLTIVQRLHQFQFLAWISLGLSSVFYGTVLFTDQFITGLYQYPWGYYPRYGSLAALFLIFFFSLLLGSLRFLNIALARSAPGVHRQRIKALLVSLGVGYLGSVDYLGAFGIPLYPIGYVPVFAFLVVMAAAVWRYRLVEITPAVAADQIIQTMTDALLVSDREHAIRIANQAASRLIGCPQEDLLGKSITNVTGHLITPEKFALLTRTGSLREYEFRYRNPEGKLLTIDVEASVTRDRSGQPIAFIFVIRDVTEHKRLEERLRQAQKLEALGKFAWKIAHEFDTLLNTIYSHSAILAGRQDRDLGVRYEAEKIRKAADRATTLKNQLLAFSTSQKVKLTVLDLNVVVTSLRGILEWVLGERFALTLRLDPALGWVKADIAQIEQVLIKLVALIRTALPRGGTVTFQTGNVDRMTDDLLSLDFARQGAYAMVAVGAPGWVIDEETRAHLFEPFVAGQMQGNMTGLELAMVYAVVKRNGGELSVESDRERGTMFRVYLPLAESGVLTKILSGKA